MDQVLTLRRRLNDYLSEVEGMTVKATITGPNAESADIRALTPIRPTSRAGSWCRSACSSS